MTGRRTSFWMGLGLIAAGLAMVGYFGWQFFGTNIVARQKQQEHVEALQKEWRAAIEAVEPGSEAEDGGDPGTGVGAVAVDPEDGEVEIGVASALLRIPRFGSDYVMPVLEGVDEDVLEEGFGHFPDTAGPGQEGNYALAAHRVTHGEPLRRMPELRPGDEVLVETRRAVYTYVLDTDPNDLVIPFTEGWVVEPRPVNPNGNVGPHPGHTRLITLTTCSELFHTDDRMVVFGHLENVEEK